jgi:tetratricopeptide (TPR) repeat protein
MIVAGAATFAHLRSLRPKPVETPLAPVAVAPQPPPPVAPVVTEDPPRETKQRPARARAERPAPEKTPEPRLPLLERLKAKYGIDDASEIFVREVEAGNYADATELYAQLPADQSAQQRVRLYFARMLMAQSAFDGVRRALAGVDLDDGEAYLYRGIVAYRDGRPSQALDLLERGNATPSKYMKGENLRREYLYFRARCLGKLFDAAPSRATYQSALDAWYEVKSNLRERPEHLYFKSAVIEMNRLSEAKPQ